MKLLARLAPTAMFLPVLAFAQAPGELGIIRDFLGNILDFINGTLVPLVFALAFFVFIWGMFKTFILGGSDEEKQKEGKQLMIYAVVGFVLMVSIWGIVNLVANGFGLKDDTIEDIPVLPQFR